MSTRGESWFFEVTRLYCSPKSVLSPNPLNPRVVWCRRQQNNLRESQRHINQPSFKPNSCSPSIPLSPPAPARKGQKV